MTLVIRGAIRENCEACSKTSRKTNVVVELPSGARELAAWQLKKRPASKGGRDNVLRWPLTSIWGSSLQSGLKEREGSAHFPRAPTLEPSIEQRASTQEPALAKRKVKPPWCLVSLLSWLPVPGSFWSRVAGFFLLACGFFLHFLATT